jgi:DNA-binding transcriptional MerR regulator
MGYTINQLAKLAGVSVRTLHYYDGVGLLKPARLKKNGYREYGEDELLRLQQIMFFRELDFPIAAIKKVMNAPHFDMQLALTDQRRLLELKKKRLTALIRTIDQTTARILKQKTMNDQQLYSNFNQDEMDKYAEEAKQRWGDTEAWRQSQERTKRLGKAGMQRLTKEGEDLYREAAKLIGRPAADPAVQQLIDRHFKYLHNFFDPSLELYRCIGETYVTDARFTAYLEKFGPGLAALLRDAIRVYCDTHAN